MQVSIGVSDNDKDSPPWSLESDLNGEATIEDFKTFITRAQWQIAEEVLKEEQTGGFDETPRVRTDNKWEKDPRDVKFMGKIEYFSRQNIAEALLEAYTMVEVRSPVRTGQYLASHYVYLNNIKIAENRGELYFWLKNNENTLKNGDKIRIINVTPYAARIEIRGVRKEIRGKNKGKIANMMRHSFGSGVYALAAKAIKGKYKAQGDVKFEVIPNGYAGVSVVAANGFRVSYIPDKDRRGKARAKRSRFSGPYVYPSVTFTIAGEGIQ